MDGDFESLIAHPKYRELLEGLLKDRLRSCAKSIDMDQVLQKKLLTSKILATLREVASAHGTSNSAEYDDARIKSRLRDFGAYASAIGKCKRYLDIGCGDGKITAAIGHALGLSKADIIGADIHSWAGHTHANEVSDAITFKQVADGRVAINTSAGCIALESGSVDLITCLMALHHMRDPIGIMREMCRILTKNGVVLIREHDSPNRLVDGMINIEHAIFEVVIERLTSPDDFRKSYYGQYRTRRDWVTFFKLFGFEPLGQPISSTRGTRPFTCAFRRNPATKTIDAMTNADLLGIARRVGVKVTKAKDDEEIRSIILGGRRTR